MPTPISENVRIYSADINLWGIIPQFILSIFVVSAIASTVMMNFIYNHTRKRFLALIDLDTGECTVVNAGHEHPAFRFNGK